MVMFFSNVINMLVHAIYSYLPHDCKMHAISDMGYVYNSLFLRLQHPSLYKI